MPYIDLTPSRRYAHRRISLTLAMLLISFMTVLSYMGLPEFAVNTNAEIEILHELAKEPAHNHVGIMRTVPFDQMTVGAYTTLQFEGSDPALALKDFNNEMQTRQVFDTSRADATKPGEYISEYDLLKDQLSRIVYLNSVPKGFKVANEPDMIRVLRQFEEDLKLHPEELLNARGVMIVSDYQANLKRVDLVVIWDGVKIENGYVALDANGKPVPLYLKDKNGNDLLNADGTQIQQTRIYTLNFYLHANSAYFD